MSLLNRFFIPFCRFFIILFYALSVFIAESQIVLGVSMPLVRRFLPPLCGFLIILCDTPFIVITEG